jgi:hypothetical protein
MLLRALPFGLRLERGREEGEISWWSWNAGRKSEGEKSFYFKFKPFLLVSRFLFGKHIPTMLDTNTNTNASTFAIAKTAHFLYEVETTEEIRARLTRLSRHEQAGSLQVLDNGAGVSKNGKAKKYFSFFMPTDE